MGTNREGDRIEFTAASIGDYTIWFSRSHDDYTDTETTKYPDTAESETKFEIRSDQNAFLTQVNEREFTNPCKITKNLAHIETRDALSVTKLIIRTTVVNTKLKIRWF